MTMVGFTHYAPTRLLFGEGQLHRLGRQDLPAGKALLVTSPGLPGRSPEVLELVAGQLEGRASPPSPSTRFPPTRTRTRWPPRPRSSARRGAVW